MSNKANQNSKPLVSKQSVADSSKLVSLLALAAGAIAAPETANAAIVYNDLSSAPGLVGYLYNPSFTITLPGTARLEFRELRAGSTSATSIRRLSARQSAGYVRIKTSGGAQAMPVHTHVSNTQTRQLHWSQIAGIATATGFFGTAKFYGHTGNSYDHDYLPFEFKDTTQGDKMLYGWVNVSFSNANTSSSPGVPQLTIWGYAYDDSGTPILMGAGTAVPEPGSASLMALGAMALGARGLRAWRKNRPNR